MIEPTENVGTSLLFENERVRVWDLALEPGQYLEKHLHHNDYLFLRTIHRKLQREIEKRMPELEMV